MTDLVRAFAKLQVRQWDGEPIKYPGIYSGIPLERYHEGDICVERSISSSGLRKLYNPSPFVKASPAHYWMNSPYNPKHNAEDTEESKALIRGRAAHHKLFGQQDFEKVFVRRPDTVNGFPCTKQNKHGKAWYAKQKRLGLTVVTKDDLIAIDRIAQELTKEPLIRAGILNGYVEHSWFWKHKSGIWLKIRPDASPNDSLDFVDLKLTNSVLWPDLQRTVLSYGYFMQAGLTAMGVRAITGQPLNSFSLVFCESSEPHCIEIVTLKEGEIARGIDSCEVAIAKFNKCWSENHWPGPRGDRADARYLELSDFDQKRMDEQLTLDRSQQ
jgi:hypothetical protein